MGQELPTLRGDVLRRSVKLTPSRAYIKQTEFIEPHRRGEILVAAVMNAFLTVWVGRLASLGRLLLVIWIEGGSLKKELPSPTIS